MPYIDLKTNVEVSDTQKGKLTAILGDAIALIPGKSEEWLMVNISEKQSMAFAGKRTACAMLEVKIFGKADKDSYDRLTKALCHEVSSTLGIAPDRIYVKYEEVSHWGWNGENF